MDLAFRRDSINPLSLLGDSVWMIACLVPFLFLLFHVVVTRFELGVYLGPCGLTVSSTVKDSTFDFIIVVIRAGIWIGYVCVVNFCHWYQVWFEPRVPWLVSS